MLLQMYQNFSHSYTYQSQLKIVCNIHEHFSAIYHWWYWKNLSEVSLILPEKRRHAVHSKTNHGKLSDSLCILLDNDTAVSYHQLTLQIHKIPVLLPPRASMNAHVTVQCSIRNYLRIECWLEGCLSCPASWGSALIHTITLQTHPARSHDPTANNAW